jgi:hypothetical protein
MLVDHDGTQLDTDLVTTPTPHPHTFPELMTLNWERLYNTIQNLYVVG